MSDIERDDKALLAVLNDLEECIETWEGMCATADMFSDEPERDCKEFRRLLRHLNAYKATLTMGGTPSGDSMLHQH